MRARFVLYVRPSFNGKRIKSKTCCINKIFLRSDLTFHERGNDRLLSVICCVRALRNETHWNKKRTSIVGEITTTFFVPLGEKIKQSLGRRRLGSSIMTHYAHCLFRDGFLPVNRRHSAGGHRLYRYIKEPVVRTL